MWSTSDQRKGETNLDANGLEFVPIRFVSAKNSFSVKQTLHYDLVIKLTAELRYSE